MEAMTRNDMEVMRSMGADRGREPRGRPLAIEEDDVESNDDDDDDDSDYSKTISSRVMRKILT